MSTDKNKERPIHYARRNGHQHIVQFLGNHKEIKKVREMKEERRVQSSSQNVVEQRKKKDNTIKSHCALMYINENG